MGLMRVEECRGRGRGSLRWSRPPGPPPQTPWGGGLGARGQGLHFQVIGYRLLENELQGGPFDWPHQNLAKSKMIHGT